MEKHPLPIPRKTLNDLINIFIPHKTPPDATIELSIKIKEKGFSIRDFAAYLTLIDKTYGRFTPRGLKSYAQKRKEQLKISTMRPGSMEIIISEVFANIDKIAILIILRSLIKYLPSAIKMTASAYREYEEARLTKERRKQLRKQIEEDNKLTTLDRRRKDQLIQLLDSLYEAESRSLQGTQRFSKNNVEKVDLQIKDKETDKG